MSKNQVEYQETTQDDLASEPVSRILDIGCGNNKFPGSLGMDVNPRTAADVIHDLDELPYPFAADSFDEVIGRHVIEHVKEPLAVMCELHRITRAGGIVRLTSKKCLSISVWHEARICARSLSSFSTSGVTCVALVSVLESVSFISSMRWQRSLHCGR